MTGPLPKEKLDMIERDRGASLRPSFFDTVVCSGLLNWYVDYFYRPCSSFQTLNTK